MNVNELETKCVKSNDFELKPLFWRIEFCKSSNFVNASLVSYLTEDAPTWSCRAEAVFKLHSPLTIKYIERNMTKRNFDIENPSHGISELIKLSEMLENYVHENESYFEVKISTETPTRSLQFELFSASTVIYVKNASTFTSYVSPPFVVRGINWKIDVRKSSDHLGIFLCLEDGDLGSNESWEVKANFKLYSWSRSTSVSENYTKRFGKKNHATCWGYRTFLEWNKFISPNNEYIKNDTAWLEVEIAVKEPKLG